MLTNDDLQKIGMLIDERLEVKLEEKFEKKLAPIKTDISVLKNNDKSIRKDIEILKRNDRKLRKDLNLVLKHLDSARASHERRITRLEGHLGLQSLE